MHNLHNLILYSHQVKIILILYPHQVKIIDSNESSKQYINRKALRFWVFLLRKSLGSLRLSVVEASYRVSLLNIMFSYLKHHVLCCYLFKHI